MFFRSGQFARYSILTLLLLFFTMYGTYAQWTWNPVVNTAVCTDSGDQCFPASCTDGQGGVIVAWEDYRAGGYHGDIYAQRISAGGTVQWTMQGVAVATGATTQQQPQILSDGNGGAIIVWSGNPSINSSDIYAQRISGAGTVQWSSNGVPICTVPGNQSRHRVCSDGNAGAIIVWRDGRKTNNHDIYVQRINAAGIVQWTTDGVQITTNGQQQKPDIVSDGSGGAIISLYRGTNPYDVYAQRIDGSGVTLWTANGIQICPTPGDYRQPQLCTDDNGGAIAVWEDKRSSTSYDISAQRISPTGALLWTTSGISVCTMNGEQYAYQIVADGNGGAIITWKDKRGSDWDIYAQRLSGTGVAQWATNGAPVCTASGDQSDPALCYRNTGEAIIAWPDDRGSNTDVFSVRLNSGGVAQWTSNGIPVSSAPGDQRRPCIAGDGMGGAIHVWEDHRGSTWDIYASRVDASGQLVPVTFQAFSARKDGRTVMLTWETASEDNNFGFELVRQVDTVSWDLIASLRGHGTTGNTHTYRYTDYLNGTLLLAPVIRYRVKQFDTDGSFVYSPIVEVPSGSTPSTPELYPPFPNPADDQLNIPLYVPAETPLVINVYNTLGQAIAGVCREIALAPGFHSVPISIAPLASGTYIVEMRAGDVRRVKSMSVVR